MWVDFYGDVNLLVVYSIGAIVWGIIWGVATNKVIENKGYNENWFWWGFLFGFIAFIVACTKPQAHYYKSTSSSSTLLTAAAEEKQEQSLLKQGGWRCNKCGKVNPSYTRTCNCGNVKASNQMKKEEIEQSKLKEKEDKREIANLQKLKSYKELLDSGVITQDEFDAKKEQLLGLSRIEIIAESDEQKQTLKETSVIGGDANAAMLLKRAFMFLEDGNWSKADSYCEKVLDQDPENAQAYLGKLMAELHVRQQEELLNCEQPFDKSINFQKAMRFGGEEFAGVLTGYIDIINERNENTRITDIYNNAVSAMKSAKTEKLYQVTAAAFKKIPGFKDADSLAEQCLEKAEICRKDAIYASAKSKMIGNVVSGYEEAIIEFSTISGWNDADEQIYACQRKIEEIKAKDEREAEERRIVAEESAKKRKKIIAITVLIVVVCITFGIVLKTVIIPSIKYNKAVALMDSGDYEAAYALLEEIGKNDAIASNKYDRAMVLIESGDYDAAYVLLNESGHSDEIASFKYDRALALMDSGDYDAAYVLLYESGHSDEIASSRYERAMSLIDSGDYDAAYAILEGTSYSDVIASSKYDRAMALIDSGDYDAAYALLEEIGNSDEIASSKYDRAVALIETGDYETAYILLDGLNYKDSDDILNSIKPQYHDILLSNAQAGSYVYFGAYEQDNDSSNGKEDIEWIVLAREDDRILVISRYALDSQEYNFAWDGSWESCSLREWLNGTFIDTAFSSEEQCRIINSTVTDFAGNYTTDKVFILSSSEVREYFSSESERLCQGTAYSWSRFAGSADYCKWWLRSPVYYSDYCITYVNSDGSIPTAGAMVQCAFGIRPVMWIEIG